MISIFNPTAWLVSFGLFFAAAPTSDNYTLKSYDIGNSGTASSSSTNYKLNGVAGGQSGATSQVSSNFVLGEGVNNGVTANVPPAPTVTNPDGYYDRLRVTVATGNNPSDTKYLIAISTDNFATSQYVQADNSVGSSQAITNYQTYAVWGGSGGFLVMGLTPSTTYQVKVKALQGGFTGSAFGPLASASTVTASISLSLTTTLTSSPPFNVSFASLTPGAVTDGDANVVVGLTSNASAGGAVYVRGSNGGLGSVSSGGLIASSSADLTSASRGYGAQVLSVSQSAGGPFVKRPPYDGSANNVGAIATSLQPIMTTVGPVTAASGTVSLKAKADNTLLSANDYTDTLTLVVAMNF